MVEIDNKTSREIVFNIWVPFLLNTKIYNLRFFTSYSAESSLFPAHTENRDSGNTQEFYPAFHNLQESAALKKSGSIAHTHFSIIQPHQPVSSTASAHD